MATEEKEIREPSLDREKTYLLLMSAIIIFSVFTCIDIETLNLLGNELNVSDHAVKTSFLIVWSYFYWIYHQASFHKILGHRHPHSEFFRHLTIHSRDVLVELAIDHQNSIGQGDIVKNKINLVEMYFDGRDHKYKIEYTTTIHPTTFRIEAPLKKFIFPSIRAYRYYVWMDSNFSQKVFPFLVAWVAGVFALVEISKNYLPKIMCYF